MGIALQIFVLDKYSKYRKYIHNEAYCIQDNINNFLLIDNIQDNIYILHDIFYMLNMEYKDSDHR